MYTFFFETLQTTSVQQLTAFGLYDISHFLKTCFVMCIINMHIQASCRGQAESDIPTSTHEGTLSTLKALLSRWIHTHKKKQKKNIRSERFEFGSEGFF